MSCAEGHPRLRARVVRGRRLLAVRPPRNARVSVTLPDGSSASGSFPPRGRTDRRHVPRRSHRLTGTSPALSEFTIGAVTEGQDALGEGLRSSSSSTGVTGAGQGVSTRHHRRRGAWPMCARYSVRASSTIAGERRGRPAGVRRRRHVARPGALVIRNWETDVFTPRRRGRAAHCTSTRAGRAPCPSGAHVPCARDRTGRSS